MGVGLAGAADDYYHGGAGAGDGAVCGVRHLSDDGQNYDAAVLAAGHCGFGFGGNADGDRQYAGDYRPFRAIAYGLLVVPMVGAFFIDIVNALVIKLYLLLPMFG